MKVFVPMPDEGADAQAFAGERLVPYACGMAVQAMLDNTRPAKALIKALSSPAASADHPP